MKKYDYLDLHVAGEPFRVLTSGVPKIPGNTMEEKRQYAIRNLDDLRKLILLEPRGHNDMYGGFLTQPVNSGSDFGALFLHGSGMSTMCGHGVIALAKAAVTLGLVQAREGDNTITLDTPSGTITLFVKIEQGIIRSISLRNPLSFAYALDQVVQTVSHGKVFVDVGYGGAFIVFADIHSFHLNICKERIPAMLEIAMDCGKHAIEQLAMVHPENPSLNAKDNGICMVLWEEEDHTEEIVRTRTFTVFGEVQFDRSPTGTGTSALAAVLHAKGHLKEGMQLINCGISGIPFYASIEEKEGMVVPSLTGNAYLTGQGSLLLEEDDPLQTGFRTIIETCPL